MTEEKFSESKITVTYDSEADAAYIKFAEGDDPHPFQRRYSEEHGHDVIIDRDINGNVLGVEVLGAGAAYRLGEMAGEAGRKAVDEWGPALMRLADS